MPTRTRLRFYICLLVFLFGGLINISGQSLTVATWNISNLGKSKDNEEVLIMARTINQYDVVAIQEVVAKDPSGAKAVARIVDELNRMGSRWDYKISDPTNSSSPYIRERYAYIWRTSKVKALRDGLDTKLKGSVEREPYWLEIEIAGFEQPVWLTNFHSRPYNQEPEKEIIQLLNYPNRVSGQPILLLGDWNVSETHEVWQPFYAVGFSAVLQNTPTTLKKVCKEGGYVNHSIDNIFFPSDQLKLVSRGVTDFVNGNCADLATIRLISDHLPVWAVFETRK